MKPKRSEPQTEDIGASAQPAPVIRFDAVGLRRADGAPIFKGLSFAMAPGTFHVLIGPEGSGKTSLLRLICGLERPSQGSVQVFGRDVAGLGRRDAVAHRRRIGAALDRPGLIEHLSVRENAALAPRVAGRPRRLYLGEVDEILRWMGLAKLADALPAALSPGERLRANLARAMAGRPELVLIELPRRLDTGERDRAVRLVSDIHRAGAAVLLAGSDEAMSGLGHPILRLAEGRAVLEEAP